MVNCDVTETSRSMHSQAEVSWISSSAIVVRTEDVSNRNTQKKTKSMAKKADKMEKCAHRQHAWRQMTDYACVHVRTRIMK